MCSHLYTFYSTHNHNKYKYLVCFVKVPILYKLWRKVDKESKNTEEKN